MKKGTRSVGPLTPLTPLFFSLNQLPPQAFENSDQLKHPDPEWRLPEALLEEVVLELSGRTAELSVVQKRDLCSYCIQLQLRLPKALQGSWRLMVGDVLLGNFV